MSNQVVKSDLLEELSKDEQQVVAGGWGRGGWGHRGWGHRGWGHRGWGGWR
ncbi:hypothetical protein ACEYW6_00800 [Nostoc sp. UIC 10607]|uniref:hypothetical protein n=1 Tax=Nostoc sp. UIC 10607 TaxID=3045935 RepID=UPI0039A0D028